MTTEWLEEYAKKKLEASKPIEVSVPKVVPIEESLTEKIDAKVILASAPKGDGHDHLHWVPFIDGLRGVISKIKGVPEKETVVCGHAISV